MDTPQHRAYRFVQVDVFTEQIFGGNPLAVFPDASGLQDAEMQAIAKEMNLSETTFVLPPTDPTCAARVRIFTPARELAFAGHPTIGTAFVLASSGRLPTGSTDLALEEGVGSVPVRLEGDPAAPAFLWMRHPPATFGSQLLERDALAHALRLSPADLLDDAPIVVGSTGSPFLYVPLRNREAVDCAELDVPALLAIFADEAAVGVFIFAPDGVDASSNQWVYSRMFAPHTSGIPEDPATGSASGPLGAYLVRYGLVPSSDHARIVSEQGTKMGRQSFVHIRVRRGGTPTEEIEVGGSVVPVLEGELRLPRRNDDARR